MIREAELEEMEKKWREENERIMREYPRASSNATADRHAPNRRRRCRSIADRVRTIPPPRSGELP